MEAEFLKALSLLIFGFVILIAGGEALIRAAISIACHLKISPAVIGLTVIAAGTSAPELMTSIMASLQGAPDIAIGNVIGSNIFNILAITGFACFIRPNKIDATLLSFEIPALLVFSILLYVLGMDGKLIPAEGVLFIILLVVFISISIRRSRKLTETGIDEDGDEINTLEHKWQDAVYLILGLTALLGGAHLALDGGVQLGRLFGLSERIIGITIISIGTGLPELATSAIAAYKGRNDIAIANVVGSNIMNILAVLGITSSIATIQISEKLMSVDMYWLIGSTVVFYLACLHPKKEINRKLGLVFILGYIGFLGFLVFS